MDEHEVELVKVIEKKVIGRKDVADFPDLEFENINIKIDTGAYTSAIHCRNVKKIVKDDKILLSFILLDSSHPQYANKEYIVENFKEKKIKSSFGTSEKRFVIKTKIKIFNKSYQIELSLSERGEMRFPVLIGRKFLMKKFIVDPSRYNLSYKRKLKLSEIKSQL